MLVSTVVVPLLVCVVDHRPKVTHMYVFVYLLTCYIVGWKLNVYILVYFKLFGGFLCGCDNLCICPHLHIIHSCLNIVQTKW